MARDPGSRTGGSAKPSEVRGALVESGASALGLGPVRGPRPISGLSAAGIVQR